MSSSTMTSIAASATALLAITTPFVQPTDCRTQWKTASESLRVFRGNTPRTLLMVSEPAATCYPSGWDDVPPESRLSYRPGVCPEGWTYDQMGENSSEAATTAFCCDRATNAGERITMVHEPWAVTWADSDTATLTPKLPTITSSMTVPTWTPGETIPAGRWDADEDTGQDNGVQSDRSFLFIIIIGLPVFGVVILGCFIWCCVRACYKRRREMRVVYLLDPTIPIAYEMNVWIQNQSVMFITIRLRNIQRLSQATEGVGGTLGVAGPIDTLDKISPGRPVQNESLMKMWWGKTAE